MKPAAITHALRIAAITALLNVACSCNRQTQQPSGVQTQPAAVPSTTASSAPATRPPDVLPASTFDTDPPYTVQLYVRKPEDKQPGWLKILALADQITPAKTHGVFPRHNVIELETENVRRLQVELGYLPLAEGQRVVLRIDGQGIEITQRDRRFVTLERRPTGQWIVEKPKD